VVNNIRLTVGLNNLGVSLTLTANPVSSHVAIFLAVNGDTVRVGVGLEVRVGLRIGLGLGDLGNGHVDCYRLTYLFLT